MSKSESGLFKWINIKDQLPPVKLMLERDILIFRENGTFATGVFYYDEYGNIEHMTFNGTGKCIELWKFKPTHWMEIETPKTD